MLDGSLGDGAGEAVNVLAGVGLLGVELVDRDVVGG